MYGSWDINWIFGHFVLFFALLPSNKMKNQNFEKLKKTPGDIIILHMSTINENYMMCGSWDMECDRQIFFSFWTIFWLFYTPIITQRIKILKNWKKHLEVSSFYTTVRKIMITCYTVPEIRPVTDVHVNFHFGLFFGLFCPLTAKKIKISKNWKKHPEISSFYTCVPKIMIRWCMIPEIWCVTKKVAYRDGCPT